MTVLPFKLEFVDTGLHASHDFFVSCARDLIRVAEHFQFQVALENTAF
jgi:hypothetical protein